jgi:hypothetical protein
MEAVQAENRIESNGQKKTGRKIALIGKAPSSVHLAPYANPEWEIWILNTLGYLNEIPRWDRQFELHDIELTKDKAYGQYNQWLQEQSKGTRPVILRDAPAEDWGTAACGFPYDAVFRTFSHLAGRKYLTNTVSLMIALAVHEHIEKHLGQEVAELGLFGIDMAQHALKQGHAGWFTSEYARQRPSVEYWVGIAEGYGIRVHIPKQSDILKCHCIYGFHTDQMWKKANARRNELQQRIAQAQQVEQQKHDEAVFLSGALEAMNYDDQRFFAEEQE